MSIVRKWMNCIEDTGHLLRVKWTRTTLMLILMLFSQVTTDWRLGTGTGCTDKHTGTSAAAPLAAGMIALMLQARYENYNTTD